MAKILIDTLGSDLGAEEIIKGAGKALERHPELSVVLSGDTETIQKACSANGIPSDRTEILDAKEEITNYDSPAEVLFTKSGSSMMKGLSEVAMREDIFGMISCGNTGVLLPASMKYLSGDTRVRPALAAVLPAENGSFTCLVDTGATIDCTPEMLHHFAHLGSDLMKEMYGVDNPKVGLLSIGAEETKGNKAVKEAHALLKNDENINFAGNIEGHKALSGACDVLVCDGFAGNQVLKVTEGTAKRILTDIYKIGKRTGSADIMNLFGQLMKIYDIGSLGGGIVLGVRKPVIKAHGNSNSEGIANITKMLLNMAENKAVFDKRDNKI